MNFAALKSLWQSSSAVNRVVSIVIAIVLLAFVASAAAGTWEHIRGNRFDRRQHETDRLLIDKDYQITQLESRAKAAEAEGELMKQRADALEALSEKQGAAARAEARKVDQAFTEYQKDQSITGQSVDDETRRRRICEKRKSLGYPCTVSE